MRPQLLLVLLLGLAAGQNVTFYLGRNPYEWENTKRITYDYKGFFDPVVDAAIDDATSTWTWSGGSPVEPEVKSLNASATSLTRSIQSGPALAAITALKDSLYGIIGISTTGEGFFGAEIADVTYIHTYNDDTSAIMDYDGATKAGIFKSSIRLGPTYSAIAGAVLSLLGWVDPGAATGTHVLVFHENSFSSDKIAAKVVTTIQAELPAWTVERKGFFSNEFDCAGSDADYFFRERYTDMGFINDTADAILTSTRALIVIGSNGFIRHVAVSLYNAIDGIDGTVDGSINDGWVKVDDFFLLAIPSTLGPKPSYNATNILSLDPKSVSSADDDQALAVFKNMLVLTEDYDETRYEEISQIVRGNFYSDRPDLADIGWDSRRPVSLWSGYTYDAALLLMKALHSDSDPADFYDFLINKAWTASDFGGIKPFCGTIDLNEYGDRRWKFNTYHLNSTNGWAKVASISNSGSETGPELTVITELREMAWPDGGPPKLGPKCGYGKCAGISSGARNAIIYVGLGILGAAILFLCYLKVRNVQRFRKALANLEWNIGYNELKELVDFTLDDPEEAAKKGMLGRYDSLASLDLPPQGHFMFHDTQVFLKPLLREFFEAWLNDKELMKELQQLTDIKSDHLVNVVGFTKDPAGSTWIVYETCMKGTLKDSLADESFEMDAQFKLSMIDDIAQGMSYIHTKTNMGSHGNLKTTNILIDGNFTLKISDFGESIFLSDMKRNYHHSEVQHAKRLLWRAPELLRKSHIDICGTPAGDLYSFAIVVHEIICRQGPFNLNSIDNEENESSILAKVKEVGTREQPFRPQFNQNVRSKYLKKIVRSYAEKWWHEDPGKRTNFKTICVYMKKLRPSKKQKTYIDATIKRLEKFNLSLQKNADALWEQAQAEKKKVEELRASLIPMDIIQEGIDGYTPETIPKVTVAVIELDGLDVVLAERPQLLERVVALESTFRSNVDSIIHKSGIHFGVTDRLHRMWFISQTRSDGAANHGGVILVLQRIIIKTEQDIEKAKLPPAVTYKAGIHTGTITTGISGDSSDAAPQFIFSGVIDTADFLCTVANPTEVLATAEAKKTMEMMKDTTLSLDWGEKHEYQQSGKKIEAFCVDLLADNTQYCLVRD